MILERLKRWSMAECFDDDSDYMEVNENSNLELKESNKKNISSDNEVHPWLKSKESRIATKKNFKNHQDNVVAMSRISNIAEVVVVEPKSFDEMPKVIEVLREQKSVVLNLNSMESEEGQRAVDFVAGGTYAIEGYQERIGESIFLFTPNCFKVSNFADDINNEVEVANVLSSSSNS
ncbi:cell division protein SepF [Candidatus Atelocyanobacterium thalassae]|jgi:cell division inhibitor SepF|uniref:Cell division protein SepF n=1 Tax=Atelocyanobacterium thalassa (isolate ALOHA) TaxID=1453429 RepID=D3EQP4_ATETH|nr:cell division protein SepF [Candidatus Atelocyanobacterium thalassa]ADB95794.1 uncharacterized conserved protein [Candidatus Atelocyanobacterium thalassa isolate ALOHA]MCH2542989.1 cell division protein SepF [Candidatus Atelocyanobacterium sp. ALOHA_A2.5_9]|tara:strand:+ start:66 stop:596 length:531 start_codon:yes stop_codon:yes gene_type:complete